MVLEITTNSPAETIELGRKIGFQLKGGEIIALIGPLGSGKTHLVKGGAAGAGAEDTRKVSSPTFVIVNEYVGRFDIYHVDAYRLRSEAEFEMLGFDEFCYPRSVVLIEWADKLSSALTGIDCIDVDISHESASARKIRIENMPAYITL